MQVADVVVKLVLSVAVADVVVLHFDLFCMYVTYLKWECLSSPGSYLEMCSPESAINIFCHFKNDMMALPLKLCFIPSWK